LLQKIPVGYRAKREHQNKLLSWPFSISFSADLLYLVELIYVLGSFRKSDFLK